MGGVGNGLGQLFLSEQMVFQQVVVLAGSVAPGSDALLVVKRHPHDLGQFDNSLFLRTTELAIGSAVDQLQGAHQIFLIKNLF